MGTPLPQKEGHSTPNFGHVLWPNGCIDEDVTWYREGVGHGPGHIVLLGTQLPPKKGTASYNFRPMSVVAKRLDGSKYHLVGR